MKNLLRADFFAMRKSKSVYILFGAAVLTGFLLPLLFFAILKGFGAILDSGVLEAAGDSASQAISAMQSMIVLLNGHYVFLTCIPMTQGFGLILTAMVAAANARPFATGIYRNKIISGCGRPSIYLSRTLISYLVSLPSAFLFLGVTAGACRLMFGSLDLSGEEWTSILLFTFGIYTAYTAICVFTAFLTRSVPVSLMVAILLPILMNLVLSFLAPALSNYADWTRYLLYVLPSMQIMFITGGADYSALLAIVPAADVVIAALLTFFGILRFRSQDLK
ncbi:MAG: hypothetical protein II715_00935 [Clostridia bacterium]|nr:hypothetical protein [Clostridia bacterium]